jgi:aryl-alcohol dehydrogenase-like predicted oxidoreductase
MTIRDQIRRGLGGSGIGVAPIGLGCMSLSGAYGANSDEDGEALINYALDVGVTMLDSADMYGWGHNEELIGRAIAGRRSGVMLATKFGQVQQEGGGNGVNGHPDYVIEACETSLKRLNVEVIDLYYQHRVDKTVPIEDTVGAMARLVEQGKVRALGLSEASPETIRRAHAVHPITAVQNEYSLLYREDAEETLVTTRELGISLVAYSPLGRSLLTGGVKRADDIGEGDGRGRHPRFSEDNLARNVELVLSIEAIAAEKDCTPAQLVLAWLLAQGDDIIPIPGTKRIDRLDENVGAVDVVLSEEDLTRISDAVPPGSAAGTRYPEPMMAGVHV